MLIHSHLKKLISNLTHWLLPPTCVLCSYPTHRISRLCLPCQQSLPILSHSCQQCAQKLHITHGITLRCGACIKNPPPFDLSYTLFPYLPPITKLITGLKFHHELSHAMALGELMVQRIQQEWYRNQALPDLIIPVPLHRKRLQERGFNQTLEIARPISRACSIPIITNGIDRTKETAAQSGLLAADRRQNMAGAFTVRRSFEGLSVVVLDDVMTTGCTITELCRELKRCGAKHITVWCCARG